MKIDQFDTTSKIVEYVEETHMQTTEDAEQIPEPGNVIRTKKTEMEGKVERVRQGRHGHDEVYFRLADGRLMKTPLDNVTVVEKLADEDDTVMEDRIDELSNELLSKYKASAGKAASAADKAGDFKTGNKRFSGIVKATKKQFDNDKKVGVEEAGYTPVNDYTVGYSKLPNYKIGDLVTVNGYQGVGKIAYIKHRADCGVIFPNNLRVGDISLEDLRPKQTVSNEGGMGGINRCAPSNDVSYQDILNDVTDKWKGSNVKVNEISKSTLGSYIKKAAFDVADRSNMAGWKAGTVNSKHNSSDEAPKELQRQKGIERAVDKLSKSKEMPKSRNAKDDVEDVDYRNA